MKSKQQSRPAVAGSGVIDARPPSIKVEEWDITRLYPYEKNPRRHNEKIISRMSKLIEQYGFAYPLLITSNGLLIDGHLRYRSALQLGMTAVPVVVCDSWTDAQRRGFRIAANRSSHFASFDLELLEQEISELSDLSVDLELMGFTEAELQALLHPDNDHAEMDESQEQPSGHPHTLKFAEDAWETVQRAVKAFRDTEQDQSIPDARCVELLCAEFAS